MKPIYTFDIETDPFAYNRDPQPFTCGLYLGDEWFYEWGDNCIAKMHEKVRRVEPGIIYAHNGGKFDWFYCMDWLSGSMPVTIINGRITRAYAWRDTEKYHELRDSFSIMPFALKNYKKDAIDYRTFERQYREKHKKKILRYLKDDCIFLHELCTAFADKFGDNLTIGATSMKELKKLHTFDCLEEDHDKKIREAYYYGGRVQCFESGIVNASPGQQLYAYDLNQCYPYSMRNFLHPIGLPKFGTTITDKTYFMTVEGENRNAFPSRTDNGLRFDIRYGIFSVSRHEYDAAVDTGAFITHSVRETVDFDSVGNFAEFVDTYHGLRRDAQLVGDKVGALFYKYVCNSCYGKFAQNPDTYKDYMITDDSTRLDVIRDDPFWKPCVLNTGAGYIVWEHPSENTSRYNVATGASITGAARSLLIRALAGARRPLYCDTDSIVCEALKGVKIDDTKLGAWKVERTGHTMAIGGRKLYAMFGDTCPTCGSGRGKPIDLCADKETKDKMFHETGCVKLASKGAHLSPGEIVDVCNGKTITWKNDAPTFDFKAHITRFLKRDVKITA